MAQKKRTPAGRPTAAELELRKARILSVATALFMEHGFAGTHVSEIARLAGVTLRTVYKYFGEKPDIFTEVVRESLRKREFQFTPITEGQSLFDVLISVGSHSRGMLFDQSGIPLMKVIISESDRFPLLMQSITLFIKKISRERIVGAFKLLGARGDIPDNDHEESALLFMDVVLGLTPLRMLMDRQAAPPDEAHLEKRVAFFMQGRFGLAVAAPKARVRRSAKSGN